MRTYKDRFEEVQGIAMESIRHHLEDIDWGREPLADNLAAERERDAIEYTVSAIRLRTLGEVDAEEYVFLDWIRNLYHKLYMAERRAAEGNPEARGDAASG